jgi:SAM-dependent methyltransferase
MSSHHVVNDVTQLNPVRVMAIVAPQRVEDVQEALRRTTGAVSIGGGRFSMGGQTASPGSLHFDMRSLNKVVSFSPVERVIRVQAGVRWCDIQRFVDPHGLSVKTMQTYANFTVGGSLSVNCHGRYVGLGPLILSVRSIRLVLHDGSVVDASRTERPELDLAENKRHKRVDQVMPLADYWTHFKNQVRNDPKAVFHNADLYAPHYGTVRSVTWVETEDAPTTRERLQPLAASYPLHQYLLWSVSESPLGSERREKLIDPLLYLRKKVHWRNFEAGYDVAELEPPSRMHRTYVLQEYFIPVEKLEQFVPRLADVLLRHKVNALNISIRHAMPDPDTLLNWARREAIETASLDLVTCHIGLHHMAPEQLRPFLASVHRVLRPGGLFVVRDHDVASPAMWALVPLPGAGSTCLVHPANSHHRKPATRGAGPAGGTTQQPISPGKRVHQGRARLRLLMPGRSLHANIGCIAGPNNYKAKSRGLPHTPVNRKRR